MPNMIVQSLWIGTRLSVMEQLAIRSYLDHGHPFHLYTYEDVEDVPAGTVVRPGTEILPETGDLLLSERLWEGKFLRLCQLFPLQAPPGTRRLVGGPGRRLPQAARFSRGARDGVRAGAAWRVARRRRADQGARGQPADASIAGSTRGRQIGPGCAGGKSGRGSWPKRSRPWTRPCGFSIRPRSIRSITGRLGV